MTSELKYDVYCPFCGEGLLFWGATGSMRKCPKCDNDLLGNKELWQALIQAKQDLEIAIKTLKHYEMAGSFDHNGEYKLDLREKTEAHKCLKQIEHKE